MQQNDNPPNMIAVEVAYATHLQQQLVALELPEGATIAEAIEASGLREWFPEIAGADLSVGIFAKVLNLGHVLKQGDRVEIYRPLCADPKEARRRRAAKK